MSDQITSIFDDYDYLNDDVWAEGYAENEGISIEDVDTDSEDYYQFIAAVRDEDRQCAIDDINDYLDGKQLICFGYAQLWDGTAAAGFVADTFDEVVDKVMGRDCEYLQIYEEEDRLYVSGIHHDGRNTVQVCILTDEGLEFIEENEDYLSPRELHQMIAENDELREVPEFTAHVWR